MAVDMKTFMRMIRGESPSYIFMFNGMVQLWEQGGNKGMVVATTRQAAQKLAVKMTEAKGGKISIAQVGSVEGETLAVHAATAVLNHGARGILATDDGETFNFFEAPPPPKG